MYGRDVLDDVARGLDDRRVRRAAERRAFRCDVTDPAVVCVLGVLAIQPVFLLQRGALQPYPRTAALVGACWDLRVSQWWDIRPPTTWDALSPEERQCNREAEQHVHGIPFDPYDHSAVPQKEFQLQLLEEWRHLVCRAVCRGSRCLGYRGGLLERQVLRRLKIPSFDLGLLKDDSGGSAELPNVEDLSLHMLRQVPICERYHVDPDVLLHCPLRDAAVYFRWLQRTRPLDVWPGRPFVSAWEASGGLESEAESEPGEEAAEEAPAPAELEDGPAVGVRRAVFRPDNGAATAVPYLRPGGIQYRPAPPPAYPAANTLPHTAQRAPLLAPAYEAYGAPETDVCGEDAGEAGGVADSDSYLAPGLGLDGLGGGVGSSGVDTDSYVAPVMYPGGIRNGVWSDGAEVFTDGLQFGMAAGDAGDAVGYHELDGAGYRVAAAGAEYIDPDYPVADCFEYPGAEYPGAVYPETEVIGAENTFDEHTRAAYAGAEYTDAYPGDVQYAGADYAFAGTKFGGADGTIGEGVYCPEEFAADHMSGGLEEEDQHGRGAGVQYAAAAPALTHNGEYVACNFDPEAEGGQFVHNGPNPYPYPYPEADWGLSEEYAGCVVDEGREGLLAGTEGGAEGVDDYWDGDVLGPPSNPWETQTLRRGHVRSAPVPSHQRGDFGRSAAPQHWPHGTSRKRPASPAAAGANDEGEDEAGLQRRRAWRLAELRQRQLAELARRRLFTAQATRRGRPPPHPPPR